MSDTTPKSVDHTASHSSAIVDGVVNLLNQLPLHLQQQVLDFVEFLLHKYQALPTTQLTAERLSSGDETAVSDELEEEFAEWEAASDEDWLEIEKSLATETH